jgi:N-acyl-D-glutamate deacylase
VIVNGMIVVKDSKVLKGVNPGQPIRYAPEKNRFPVMHRRRSRKTKYR